MRDNDFFVKASVRDNNFFSKHVGDKTFLTETETVQGVVGCCIYLEKMIFYGESY